MTTAKTLKTLRKAFADLEAAYVGIETVCRESEVVSSERSVAMMDSMRAAHFQFRLMRADVELHAKEREETV